MQTQNQVIKKVVSQKKVGDLIVSLIQKRLKSEGTYSYGDKIETYRAQEEELGYRYSFATIYGGQTFRGKIELSGIAGIYDHVTLYSTGSFYKSMTAVAEEDRIIVAGEDGGLIAESLDTQQILELNEDESAILSEFILEDLQNEIINIYNEYK